MTLQEKIAIVCEEMHLLPSMAYRLTAAIETYIEEIVQLEVAAALATLSDRLDNGGKK